MSQRKYTTTTQGCASPSGKQLSILSFLSMSTNSCEPSCALTSNNNKKLQKLNSDKGKSSKLTTAQNIPVTIDQFYTSGNTTKLQKLNPDTSTEFRPKIITSTSLKQVITQKSNLDKNKLKQSTIIQYYTPKHLTIYAYPIKPKKPQSVLYNPEFGKDLRSDFNQEWQPTTEPVAPQASKSVCKWTQTHLTDYFRRNIPLPSNPPLQLNSSPQSKSKPLKKPKSVRQALLRYGKSSRPLPKITRYTIHMPTYDLFDSWGHSLEPIDPNSTFRVFLQNPNGLAIHANNHLLFQDLQTCYQYGAGMICLPETNTNWNQGGQVQVLHTLFKRIWRTSTLQVSQTPDQMLSTYQPGGTLTAVCDNWVSRLIAKGEDPFGLGRWSYVMLTGNAETKVTVVTAYNATVSPGECTYYHQQLRILSRLY
jgi:hypothetical protein